MKRFKTPDGWSRKPLKEIAEVRTGVAKGKTGLRDPIDLPYLRVANVQDGHLDLDEIKLITVERQQIARYSLRTGDILMTEGGDFDKLGRGAVWRGQIEPCLHQNHIFAVRPQAELIDSNFLSALAASQYGRTYFLSCAKRSTNLASINAAQLKAFPVLLPNIREQRLISEAIAAWDQSIAVAELLVVNSKKQKSVLARKLLTGQLRLGECAEKWKSHFLGELFSERIEPANDGLPLLSITRDTGVVLRESVGRKDTSNNDKSKYLKICVGDIGYNTMRMWQGVSALSSLEGIISPAYTVITPRQQIDGGFAAHLFKSKHVIFSFYRHSQGLVSDTWNLKFPHFATIKVTIPQLNEQRAIVKILNCADQTISAFEKKVEALKREKFVVVEQLLTGKRRMRLPGELSEATA